MEENTLTDEQLDNMLATLREENETNNFTSILTLTKGDEIYLKTLNLKIQVK